MTAAVIPFPRPHPVPRVEILSPGVTADGQRILFVDLVEDDGRCGMWDGRDLAEAREAAEHCAQADSYRLPVFDLTGVAA